MKNWYQLTESETLDKLGVTSEGPVSYTHLRPYGNNPYNCGNRFNVFGKC